MNQIEARIERMVYGGDGLGRLEGRVVMAPFVLPGELVAIRPVKEDPRLLRGRLDRIIEPSSRRVDPECPYFARCGGCHYQHAGYDDQLAFKADILVETLRRIGKFEAPDPEIVTGEPWQYRNRVQFKVIKRGSDFQLGYLAGGTNRLVGIEQCPISSPAINATIPELYALGRRQDFPSGLSEIEVVDGNGELLMTIRGDGHVPETLVSAFRERLPRLVSLARADAAGGFFRLWGRGHLTVQAAGFGYRVSHGVFFQVNRFLADSLSELATRDLTGDVALDLYAGAGYFTMPLARSFKSVEAVEANAAASRDLRANYTRAELENVTSHRIDTAEYLSTRTGPRPDAVLLDPPRAGLGATATKQLAALQAPVIVYVSCDPPTLSRDLAVLLASGYRLEKLFMVDLFPQTFHIEAVAIARMM